MNEKYLGATYSVIHKKNEVRFRIVFQDGMEISRRFPPTDNAEIIEIIKRLIASRIAVGYDFT